MLITFNINYRTQWGESLYITGNHPTLGNGNPSLAIPMTFNGAEHWTAVVQLDVAHDVSVEYHYIVRHDNGEERHEWGSPHHLEAIPGTSRLEITDHWQDRPYDKPFYSSAFTDCIDRRSKASAPAAVANGVLQIRVDAPLVSSDCVVALSGGIKALGNWDTTKAIMMNDARYPEWSANISLRDISGPFEYKFLILNKATGKVIEWENRDNRMADLHMQHGCDTSVVISGLRYVYHPSPWRGAGVAIPVFSLRSDDDFGVGDFLDLKMLIDWAVATGQKFIQILPINDTTMTGTWTDSYPYNANSTFALHPMYLRPQMIAELADKKRRSHYAKLQRELNKLPTVDYERANRAKLDWTRELFVQDGPTLMDTADFKAFVARNESWLMPYAAFCTLRDINNTPDMSRWGEYAVYDEARVGRFINEHREDVNFVLFQQYYLDKQLREVRDYAHSKGIAIKGDIPIGISRTSVDAWINPRLFNLDCQAGAPPDDFSVLGQNWGFPTYNWEEMSRDGFAWWKARFNKMAEYFDAYRIDHVLGFFRIWQIPMDAIHGLLGVFNPALPYSPEEMRQQYDFWIDVDRQTTPYIMDWFLGDFFGEYTAEVRERFLDDAGNGRYRLKPEFDNQRKVAAYFAGQEKSDKNNRICDALLGLIDNVLFIEDPYEQGKYHPRITAQYTYAYRSLTDYEKWCYDRLYNDFFYRRHNDFWYGKAMWKLPPLIDATNMLVCAEDLGMIPACVPAVMERLEILSLEIQRMPKDPASEFGDTWRYPYYSVCTTSTHDMGGIRQWWEENREKTQHYYNNVLHEGGTAPHYAEPWICSRIVELHLKSPSMLCILPLQDYLATDGRLRRENPLDEQINVPANPRHYWRYRMHLTLEQLIDAGEFNSRLKEMIAHSGR